jgi:hypothetical protein
VEKMSLKFGSPGNQDGQFFNPFGVAVSHDNKVQYIDTTTLTDRSLSLTMVTTESKFLTLMANFCINLEVQALAKES